MAHFGATGRKSSLSAFLGLIEVLIGPYPKRDQNEFRFFVTLCIKLTLLRGWLIKIDLVPLPKIKI